MPRKTLPLAGFAAAIVLAGAALAPVGAAVAAPGDPEGGTYSQTFTPSAAQTTFTIPENATDVQITVAGSQGGKSSATMPRNGGAGGVVTVALEDDYSGQTLHLLVPPVGLLAPGAGSYVATDDAFLAIAGGGGRSGYAGQVTTVLAGGAGGFAGGSPNGGDGQQPAGFGYSGLGAIGGIPGRNGFLPGAQPPASTGTTASVTGGVIQQGRGSVVAGFGGASGYAGGGAPANGSAPGIGIVRGASGGGSGYVAPGLTILSTAANATPDGTTTVAPGFITITWTEPTQVPEVPDTPDAPAPVLPTPGRGADEPALPIVAG